MKQFMKSVSMSVANRSRLVRDLATFIHSNAQGAGKPQKSSARDSYEFLKQKFVENGRQSSVGEAARREIVARFEEIDSAVPIGTTPTDGLVLSQLLINCRGVGDIVECGCYAGGSSAKLSIIAKVVGRRLTVFDSFEGLPEVDSYNLRDKHLRRDEEWVTDWTAGRYRARLDVVRDNVQRFGEIDVCTFVKGWFNETLNTDNLPRKVGFAFTDVDIASSARDCLAGLWPCLSDLGIFVSHDVAWVKVLQALYDKTLWEETFKEFPPLLFGAGFGIYDESPHLGYFVKGEEVPSDYLKEITINQ